MRLTILVVAAPLLWLAGGCGPGAAVSPESELNHMFTYCGLVESATVRPTYEVRRGIDRDDALARLVAYLQQDHDAPRRLMWACIAADMAGRPLTIRAGEHPAAIDRKIDDFLATMRQRCAVRGTSDPTP